MNAATYDRHRAQVPWSVEAAVLVALAPLVATAILVWAELHEYHGTTVLSFLACGVFFLSPSVGAFAVSRARSAVAPLRIVASIVFAALLADWLVFVPRPTQPGLSAGGIGFASALVCALGGAIAWYVASRRAGHWIDRGHGWLAVAFAGTMILAISAAFCSAAVLLPLP